MKFQNYELLSYIIPGYVLIAVLQFFYPTILSNLDALPSVGLAFLVGYVTNALSSWLEGIYYWTWRGKPSNNLLEGKDIWKVRFKEASKVKDSLAQKFEIEPTNDELFSTAMRIANNSGNDRIKDFNASYALSRGILTVLLITSGIILVQYYHNTAVVSALAIIIVITWLRTKQRGYYYAKEILNTYLREEEKA